MDMGEDARSSALFWRKFQLSKANRVFRESRRISERFRNLMLLKSINLSLSKFKEKTPLISRAIPTLVNSRAYQNGYQVLLFELL